MALTQRIGACVACCCAALLLAGCSQVPPEARESATTAVAPVAVPQKVSLGWTVLPPAATGEDVEAVSADYVVTLSRHRRRVVVRDAGGRDVLLTWAAPKGREVDRVLLEAPSLVIVTSDPDEELADRVVVLDLRTRMERGLAAGAPALWMGPWSLGEGVLTYGTRTSRGSYCLAAVDLGSLDGEVVECAARGHGMSQVEHSPFGLTYGRWDDARPTPCTTLRVRRGSRAPVDALDAAECKAWEAIAVKDGLVWSVIPRPRQPDEGEVFVRTAEEGTQSLGHGAPGSLTWCGDFVWFVRQMGGGRIMRWSREVGLETAFEAGFEAAGSRESVLSFPVCSGASIAFVETVPVAGAGVQAIPHLSPATR